MIHSWRRPREQRFRPGSRLSNWKNEANARYRHGGQVSLTLSNQMTKLENEIRMLAMACGEEAQNLNTYRLTPGLLWIAATHLDEPSDYLSRIYWRVSEPHECRARVCAKGFPGNESGGLCRLVLLTVYTLGLYECENMLAAYCDAVRCMHYTLVTAPAFHAMQ